MVSHNSYDGDFFTNKNKEKISNKVIFVGNLLRFEGTRGIDFLIDAFNDSRLKQYTLEIIGGPENIKNELKGKLKNSNNGYSNLFNFFLFVILCIFVNI